MVWKCEVWDLISEWEDSHGNHPTAEELLCDELNGTRRYHRVSIAVHIVTFAGKTQKSVSHQIDELTNAVAPCPMFIGKPDFRWSKI